MAVGNGAADNTNRSATIEAVRTPLSFLVLALLIVEATLGLFVVYGGYRSEFVWFAGGFFAAFIAVVVALAVLKPEALFGQRPRPPVEEMARRLADDLHPILDGYLRNDSQDASEAWSTIIDGIEADPRDDALYASFSAAFALRISRRVNAGGRARRLGPGPLR